MLMMKQVFVGFQDKRLLSPEPVFSFPNFIGGLRRQWPSEEGSKRRASCTSSYRFSPLAEGNGTQTIRGSRGSDTAELCTACPCTPRAPPNIEALSKAWRSQLWGEKAAVPPPLPPPPLQLFSPGCKHRSGPRLLSRLLWTERTLETSCRHVVEVAPFCLRHSRSAFPPVISGGRAQTFWQLLNVFDISSRFYSLWMWSRPRL